MIIASVLISLGISAAFAGNYEGSTTLTYIGLAIYAVGTIIGIIIESSLKDIIKKLENK